MPTPSNRTPVRIARGTYSNLNSSLSDLQEGEICYATDQDKLYVVESSTLVSTQASLPTDNAVTGTAQIFTAGQRAEITTLSSSSGSVAIDFAASNNFHLTLSEAVTAITVTGTAPTGQSGSIFIEQPSSGGPHAVGGWASAFLFSGAAAPQITQTASKCDRIDYTILSSTKIQVVWSGNY